MELQRLIAERRTAPTALRRRMLSKDVQKETRRELRRWHSIQAEKILGEFKDLDKLHGIVRSSHLCRSKFTLLICLSFGGGGDIPSTGAERAIQAVRRMLREKKQA